MVPVMLPAPQDIQSVVEEEITSAGGEVLDCLADSRRLFLRCVLPFADDVRPRDRVQGGVAVMAGDLDICIHPYTYREVCRNGAIMARTIETHRIERVGSDAPADVAITGRRLWKHGFQSLEQGGNPFDQHRIDRQGDRRHHPNDPSPRYGALRRDRSTGSNQRECGRFPPRSRPEPRFPHLPGSGRQA